MNVFVGILLAAMSVWDYPARQAQHECLSAGFVAAVRARDAETMKRMSQAGAALLPDDPTWRYNLACSLAAVGEKDVAFDELERAIDLGFCNAGLIAEDDDFAAFSKEPRFAELLAHAREKAAGSSVGAPEKVPAEALVGGSLVLGERNVIWDLGLGCFRGLVSLTGVEKGGNAGDLYSNRDGGHSLLDVRDFPGLTRVGLDAEGRARRLDMDLPCFLFSRPTFGNASLAYRHGAYWRSLPRALMTTDAVRMPLMCRLYLANQVWVFPAHRDCPPVGEFGDVFSSISPYWLVTAGSSWTDQPYLRGALEASRSFPHETKADMVSRGLLAPTVMTLIRKSLKGVTNETAYLSVTAHPTAFPAGGLDVERLKVACKALRPKEIPPIVPVKVAAIRPSEAVPRSEITYSTPFASAWILRAADTNRVFLIEASGAADFEFVLLRDGRGAAKLERRRPTIAKLTVDRRLLASGGRVDLAVFGRNGGTGWGAPSYVSFAVVGSTAPYTDPYLNMQTR